MFKPTQKEFALLSEKEKLYIIDQLENSIEKQKDQYLQTIIKGNNFDQFNLNSFHKNNFLKNITSTDFSYSKYKLINNNKNNYNIKNNLSLSSSSTESKKQKQNIIKQAEKALNRAKSDIKEISKTHNIKLNKSNGNIPINKNDTYDIQNMQEIFYNFELPLNSDHKENNIKNINFERNDDDINFENSEIRHSIENENIISYNYEDDNESETHNSNHKFDNIADISKIEKFEKESMYNIANSKNFTNLENEIEDKKIIKRQESTVLNNINELIFPNDNIFDGEIKNYLNVISKKYKPKYTKNKNIIIKNKDTKFKFTHNKTTKNSDLNKLTIKKINGLNRMNKTPVHKKVKSNEVFNRLYYNYKKIILNRNILKNKIEQEKLKPCSFKPKINLKSRLIMENKNQNIYQRNEEYETIKQENISKRRQKMEEKNLIIGQPKINSKPKIIVLNNRNKDKNDSTFKENQKLFNRLYSNKKKNAENILYNNELKECTHKELNHNNYIFNENNLENDIIKNKTYNIGNFFKTQKNFKEQKKEKNFGRIVDHSPKNYIFKPSINRNDKNDLANIYLDTSENNKYCNDLNQYNRLYNEALIMNSRKKFLENFYNSQYKSNPKINEFNKTIGESKINQPTKKLFSKSLNNIKINENNDEYDFEPKLYINTKYNNKESNYKYFDKIIEKFSEENEKKKEIIKKYQNSQRKQGTIEYRFTPEINKKNPNYNENNIPIFVKNVNKYLEQVEKLRKERKNLKHMRQNNFSNKNNKFFLTNDNKIDNYDISNQKKIIQKLIYGKNNIN